MRKILVLALMLAGAAFARESSIYVGTGAETPDIWDGSPGDVYFGAAEFEVDGVTRCDGAVTLGDDPADVITITGSMVLTSPVSFPVGTALLPGIYFTGDPNTGYWWSAADTINISYGGVEQLEIDAVSLDIVPDTNVTGALDVDGDTDLDAVTISEQVDLAAGTAADPTLVITGSLTTGFYQSAADEMAVSVATANVGTWDAAGYSGVLGGTTPADATVTTFTTTGQTDLDPGAAATPTLAITGSLTTGFYQSAADEMAVAVATNPIGIWDAAGYSGIIGGTTPADCTVTTFTTTGQSDFDGGAAATPSIVFTGSLTSGFYEVGADSPGVSIATANVGTWDATGYQGALGQAVPAAADVTTLTTTDVSDFVAGAVGGPSIAFTGSATTGLYEVGADSPGMAVGGANVGTWDGAGYAGDISTGDVGTVTPGLGTFTDVDVGGDFNFGQDPVDLIAGYKDRSDYVTFLDTFSVGVDAAWFRIKWDDTTVVGGGTADVTTTDGWCSMTTGGAGVDSNSVRSWGLHNYRAYAPRMESVVDLTNLVTQRFEWGFWAGAAEYVMIVYDVGALGGNWYLQVDDTAGVDSIDSTVAVTVNPTKLEIRVAADGTVTWAIDDVAMPVGGLANQMTANAHYTWWELTDQAAAAHTVAVDYVQIEQLKIQP